MQHHFTIKEMKYDKQPLLDLYDKLKDCKVPWNDYKKLYNPNFGNQPRGDNGLGAIYAPYYEGKELIEYPAVQNIIKQINWADLIKEDKNGNTKHIKKTPQPIDCTFMTYEPGFVFKKHIDREMHWNLFLPLLPHTGFNSIKFWKGTDADRDIETELDYEYEYDHTVPNVLNGKVLHSVDEIKEFRVMFRIKCAWETFEAVKQRYEEGTLLNVSN